MYFDREFPYVFVDRMGLPPRQLRQLHPPMPWNNSVQGLTQHFEQMSMKNTVNPADLGHIPDNATAEVSQITLKHDEISTELSSTQVKIFPALELVPTSDRHHGTRLQLRAIGVQFNWTLSQEIVLSAALTGKFLTILLEEMRDRD